MAGTVEFELVSPERLLLSEQVAMVVVPGEDGNFGVLPGHAPLISTVRPGVMAGLGGFGCGHRFGRGFGNRFRLLVDAGTRRSGRSRHLLSVGSRPRKFRERSGWNRCCFSGSMMSTTRCG